MFRTWIYTSILALTVSGYIVVCVTEWYVAYPDRELTDVTTTSLVPSPAACCAECAGTGGCIAAEFNPGTGTCRLGDRDPVHAYSADMVNSTTDSRVFVQGNIATATCDVGWLKLDAFCYRFIALYRTHAWSQQNCRNINSQAHLAYINSVRENDFITQVTFEQGLGKLWIGMDYTPGEPWRWANGESVTFHNFAPGEPNSLGARHCVVVTNSVGQWDDRSCQDNMQSVCQKPLY